MNAPESWDAWRLLGRAHVELSPVDEAIAAYRRALQANPNDASSWYLLGDALARQPDDPGVLEAYERLRNLDEALAGQFLEDHRESLSRSLARDAPAHESSGGTG